MKRFCLALDLKNDADLIASYEDWHKQVWPEIKRSIWDAGVTGMEIYRTANRLCMIMETIDEFSFERKREMDRANPVVQKWEDLMWSFQQPLPHAAAGDKWILMDKIFELGQCP
jgi:L-rhamnose mutarotase